MSHQELHIHHCILYEFQQRKSAAEAFESIRSILGEDVVSHSTYRYWFRHSKAGDRKRSGMPQTLRTDALQVFLDENPSQTHGELAEQLGVDQATISKLLHEMGTILELEKWVPHELDYERK